MNPCCGQSLRTGAFIVALVEIIFATTGVVFYSLGLSALEDIKNENELKRIENNFRIPFINLEEKKGHGAALMSVFGVALVSCLIILGISVFLIVVVKQGNLKKLRVWIIIKVVLLCMAIVYLFATVILGYTTTSGFCSDVLSIGLHFYFLWVVYSYMVELKEELALKMSPSIIQTQGKIDVSFPL